MILAYADHFVITSKTAEGLQSYLDIIIAAKANILNLIFRPDKCATLAIICRKNESSRESNTPFDLQNSRIPDLSHKETYRYLGVSIGLLYNPEEMTNHFR